MRNLICLGLLLAVVIAGHAQSTFEFTIDYDHGLEGATGILPVDDGFIVLGNGPGIQVRRAIKIFKVDTLGTIVWKKIYSHPDKGFYTGITYNISIIPGIGFVFSGTVVDTLENANAYIFYLTNNGDSLLFKEYASSTENLYAQGSLLLPDKGLIITGRSVSITTSIAKLWALRIDSLGNVVWDKTYTVSGSEGFSADYNPLRKTFLLQGYSNGRSWLIETDSSGNVIWQNNFGSSNTLSGSSGFYTSDGGILFRASQDTIIPDFRTGWDKPDYIAKLDSNKNLEWKTYFPIATDLQNAIPFREVSDGYLFGSTINDDSIGNQVAWLGKLDFAGNNVWNRFYYHYYGFWGEQPTDIWDADVLGDGSIVVVGVSFEEDQDFWVAKLDSMGCLIPGCDTMPCRYPPCDTAPCPIPPCDTLPCPLPHCDTVGIYEVNDPIIKVYPTPANNQLIIETQSPTGTFALYDITGKKQLQYPLTQPKTVIDITHLPTGLYLYEAGHTRGKVQVVR